MGYYSFYKILKDILRTIFGKKFLIILFLFILIFTSYVILFKNNTFAYYNSNNISNTFQITYNNSTYNITVPSSSLFDFNDVTAIYGIRNGTDVNFYVIINYPDSTLKVRTSGTTNYVRMYTAQNSNTELNQANGAQPYVFRFKYNLNSQSIDFIHSSLYAYVADNYNSSTYEFLYATKNVYNYSNYNQVYFSKNSIEIKYPEVANSLSDLESLNFDYISVNGWDYSNEEFYILFYDKNYNGTDTTESLYPKRAIKISKNTPYYKSDLSANPNVNAIFWIPINETGLNFYIGGKYAIRFALKIPRPTPVFGSTWYYDYLGSGFTFTISSDVSQNKINAINQEIQDTTQQKYHDETINSIDNLNNNVNNLNNSMNNVNDALTNTTPDSSLNNDIMGSFNYNNSNSQLTNNHNGFFSRLTSILSNIYDYDLSSVSTINIPFPHSNKSLVLRSDIISSHIVDPLKSLISAFWMFIFYYYCWRFLNFMFIQIEEGKILDEQDPSNVPGTLYAHIF